MALFTYRFSYGPSFGVQFDATNVQSVTMNIGRRRQLDQYNADTATVVLRYPSGYVSPETLFVSGTFVKVFGSLQDAPVLPTPLFVGKISDVNVEYGIPFVSNIGNADYVTISCEGVFASLGRALGENFAMPADSWSQQCANILTETGIQCAASVPHGGLRQMAATTISSTWGDWVNRSLLTVNGRMLTANFGLTLTDDSFRGTTGFVFSDTTNDATNFIYDQIQFSSYADNFYTQVTVTPESFAAATVQTGTEPYRTLLTNTFNASTGQATDFANYLLGNYQTPVLAVTAITCNLNAQLGQYPNFGSNLIGDQVSVLFRGTTYQCVIEGSTFSGTAASSTATFYVSGADLNAYLLLDNATFGRLDFNKLGY